MDPANYTIGIPFLIVVIANWLMHDTLPRWINAAIVVIVTFTVATIWAVFTRSLVGGWIANIMLIAGVSFGIMAVPELAGVRQWIRDTFLSPFSVLAPSSSAPLSAISQGMISSAVAPVTKRASILPGNKTWVRSDEVPPAGESVIDKVVPPPEQTPPS
ncbi:MAG TPA: hypothetical protein VKR06_46170 [Ktedonosporobacter sp.]|nr:hypothetical protein [Ktedonosporobacter sp.]